MTELEPTETENLGENKGKLTPEEFNQLAHLGLGKVYFLPTERVEIDSYDRNNPISRLEKLLRQDDERMIFSVSPSPGLIILPADKEGSAYVIVCRNGYKFGIKKGNVIDENKFDSIFNPDLPLNIISTDIENALIAIANKANPLPYLQNLARNLNFTIIDPSRSEDEFAKFEEIFNQSLETAQSLKKERQARQNRVDNTFDPELRRKLLES